MAENLTHHHDPTPCSDAEPHTPHAWGTGNASRVDTYWCPGIPTPERRRELLGDLTREAVDAGTCDQPAGEVPAAGHAGEADFKPPARQADEIPERWRALAFNAIAPALAADGRGFWLPLNVRSAVADAVLGAVMPEVRADLRDQRDRAEEWQERAEQVEAQRDRARAERDDWAHLALDAKGDLHRDHRRTAEAALVERDATIAELRENLAIAQQAAENDGEIIARLRGADARVRDLVHDAHPDELVRAGEVLALLDGTDGTDPRAADDDGRGFLVDSPSAQALRALGNASRGTDGGEAP